MGEICNYGEKPQELNLRISDPEPLLLRLRRFNVSNPGGGDMGKAEKIMAMLADSWPRWAGVSPPPRGPFTGPPGSGKTTFLRALHRVARARGVSPLWVRAKECKDETVTIRGAAPEVRRRVSAVLQFTATNGFRPAFDALAAAPPEARSDLAALREWAERRFKPDVAQWVSLRLEALAQFIREEDVLLPLCMAEEDELIRRIVIGLLYVLRGRIAAPVLLDDALAFVLNEEYSEAFAAMMRPFISSINRYLDTKELLHFSPIVITPDRVGGIYRLARSDKYVVFHDAGRIELPLREVQRLAEG